MFNIKKYDSCTDLTTSQRSGTEGERPQAGRQRSPRRGALRQVETYRGGRQRLTPGRVLGSFSPGAFLTVRFSMISKWRGKLEEAMRK